MDTRNPLPPLLAALALAAALPAQAGDRCLVGTWEPQGNAMADWVRRNTPPGMRMQFEYPSASMTFRADGSYLADLRGQASATRAGSPVTARVGGQFGGEGRWSTSEGRLTLDQARDRGSARMEVAGPDGTAWRGRVPTRDGTQSSFGYRCQGDRLETTMQLPGSGDTIVQPYLRKDG